MSDSNDTGKIIGALLLGAAIGAGLGLLFAPDKGSETRKKIFNSAKDLADDIKEKVKGHGANCNCEKCNCNHEEETAKA